MTVQEYLDKMAEKMIADAVDGTMPEAIRRDVQPLLDRIQEELDAYGHIQVPRIPAAVLAMPWEKFHDKLEQLEQIMREH